jgi:hypothetical protein
MLKGACKVPTFNGTCTPDVPLRCPTGQKWCNACDLDCQMKCMCVPSLTSC